jgi:hypothetical protein
MLINRQFNAIYFLVIVAAEEVSAVGKTSVTSTA